MFDLSKISAAYSGKKGCACGCKGKYAYASAHKAERPSYLEGEEGISDRSVRQIASKVEAFLRSGEAESVMIDQDWIAVDLAHDRTYTLYFAA